MKLRVEVIQQNEDGQSYGFITEPGDEALIMTSVEEVREEIQKKIDVHGAKYWYDVQEESPVRGWEYFGMVYQEEPGTWDWDLPEN